MHLELHSFFWDCKPKMTLFPQLILQICFLRTSRVASALMTTFLYILVLFQSIFSSLFLLLFFISSFIFYIAKSKSAFV